MNARTSSSSSIGGGKTLYILGIGFENDIAFALILNMPDELLLCIYYGEPWQSATVPHMSSLVIHLGSLRSKDYLREPVIGTFSLSRDSTHTEQTPLQPGAKIGPLNSLTGSEHLHLAFLVTPSILSKLIFSTSDSSSISQIGVNFPQTAQPASSNTPGEVSSQKSDTIF